MRYGLLLLLVAEVKILASEKMNEGKTVEIDSLGCGSGRCLVHGYTIDGARLVLQFYAFN